MILKIILAVLLSVPIPGFESVLACQDFPPATVAVNVKTGTILERFDVTANDLQRAAASSGIQPRWPGLGVYASDVPMRRTFLKTHKKQEMVYTVQPSLLFNLNLV